MSKSRSETWLALIMASIAKLGFDIKDVKLIDHEGYRAYIDTHESEFRRGVVH